MAATVAEPNVIRKRAAMSQPRNKGDKCKVSVYDFKIKPILLSSKICLNPPPAAMINRIMEVLFTGLNNPRGLEFGPDGNLYVAEGGTGGVNSTEGICEQVVFPVGPYLGSPTGSGVSMITPSGMM